MADPNRQPDHEFALTEREVHQALADFLVRQGRLVQDGRPSESTIFIVGFNAPSVFKIWLEPIKAVR